MYIPPEETLMTRAGALAVSSGISRFVSKHGPSTFVASASSLPSAESARSAGSTPALLTRTSRRGSSAVKRGEGPHVAQVAHVAQTRPSVAVPGRLDYGSARSLSALLGAREQPDARAEPRKPLGGRQAEPRGRAGDEDRLAVHRR